MLIRDFIINCFFTSKIVRKVVQKLLEKLFSVLNDVENVFKSFKPKTSLFFQNSNDTPETCLKFHQIILKNGNTVLRKHLSRLPKKNIQNV